MKRNKQITIDEEIYDFLKNKENASALVNELLKNHIAEQELNDLGYEELKAEKEILNLQKQFEEKARELRRNARNK